MRRFPVCLFLLLAVGAGYAQRPEYGGKLKPEQANMDVRHYTIDLALNIPEQSLSGYAIVNCILKEPATGLLFDLMDSSRWRK